MADPVAERILTRPPPRRGFDFPSAVRWVRAEHGRGQLAQTLDLARLALRHGFEPKDYYLYGLSRPGLGPAERRAYLSSRGIEAFNLSLNPPELHTQHKLVNDKLLCQLLFERCAVPVPRLLAHAATHFRCPSPATLTSAEEVLDFLRRPGALPCFGKPVHGSRGIGAASFISLSEDGETLRLGDGREVSASALAGEVLASFPEGYIFQELLRHGPGLAAAIGVSAATLRIITLATGAGVQPLYAVLRLPAAGSMVDSALLGRVVVALIDPGTGRIVRAQDLFRVSGRDVTEHPETGAALPGLELPHFAEALRIVTEAHGLFAEHGILGWDVILGAHGPVVTEVNANPLHYLYQHAADRGLLNADLLPAIEAARALVAARLAALGKGGLAALRQRKTR